MFDRAPLAGDIQLAALSTSPDPLSTKQNADLSAGPFLVILSYLIPDSILRVGGFV